MFIGKNLANLRIMHGYSRKQLSEMLGVTEQAVWQYENAYTSPKMQIVNELKRIFSVKSKYFYTEDMLARYITPDNVDVMNIAYRSKLLNVISKTQAEAKHVEYLDTFVNYVTAKVSLPTLKIIRLRDEVIEYLNHTEDDRSTQIYHVAHLARKRLDLSNSNNDDLMFLIEKSGVFVFEKAIGEEIDAYSLWTQNDRPYIILGNMKRSAVRRNFNIAHELGHLLLHYRLEFANLDRKEHKMIENEADIFAGALLLPEDDFALDMRDVSHITNPDDYLDLKKKWKTSLQVLGYRAANLGIIEPKDHRNFYAAMHRKGYLKIEPLDDVIPIQKPMKIKTIIDFVSKKGLVDIGQMIEDDWKVEVSFFHHMTGIDPSFFNKYMTRNLDFGFQNVIKIPEL
ncbi:ImmA/IrrE family metallo-endopeptidase [Paenibacillus thiaminolyticus]|uniref:ImmA/IrrE family metallo-endopeptidase n=1 Tax=Paenibacillus thiaminolyticus TaxID=49283 RepID=A0AAP9DVF2_PANTH|nr:ImmA/IrrE family metallo-endopeptidase [Paenibacillus thiaminolyticus]MCY9534079.1 ImmA/IrrE family metallo-endopeptidase [Paenibacillus thiaminolyticus]MCY9600109.1 ImmA/IrrE family metallo-endopeptidase [Paenibacillus thiaminolyticus]MCY9608475.1 ImmA/IrrE family metallo-endopeptidase [Paenibacillus thiaminolyticus]MCY9615234.1 ImmA/IrrE family metallo-endopeptidase [Paenibacillus thiaminolyticus]MCY9620559.1 ImmA/IrrE family metallo-endopeptidase [Paenibacillus thiaminolyticus]